jgi:hypothetical protein
MEIQSRVNTQINQELDNCMVQLENAFPILKAKEKQRNNMQIKLEPVIQQYKQLEDHLTKVNTKFKEVWNRRKYSREQELQLMINTELIKVTASMDKTMTKTMTKYKERI